MKQHNMRQEVPAFGPLYNRLRVKSERDSPMDTKPVALACGDSQAWDDDGNRVRELRLMQDRLSSLYSRFGKPVLDYVMTTAIILALLPFMLFITILVKMTSRGPAVFRQKRVGLHNCIFIMYKFRSMYIESPTYSEKPCSSNDPRITLVGKWLRKTSLDELPQLLNILKGEMSLVGPRPEMPFLAKEYNEWENRRHLVKPGMTGLWQLSPDRTLSIRDGIRWDHRYIENLSLLNDLKLLLRTFKVFGGGNTY